jgi:hypothetical protein
VDELVVLFHASPSVNRPSITANGLDVSRMLTSGIAGGRQPEANGVHLAETLWEAFWYASFGQHALVDIWEVGAAGLRLHEVHSGWLCEDVVAPDRLSLAVADVAPDVARNRLDSWQEIDAET